MIDTISQTQICSPMTASMAIRGRVRRWYFGDLSISVCSFIEKASKEPRPCRVKDRFCQAMVFHHAPNVEILDGNHAIFINYFAALLMSEIMPLVRYSLVYARNHLAPLLSFLTTTRGRAQSLLSFGELLFFLAKKARVFYAAIIAQVGKAAQTSINTCLTVRAWQWRRINFTREAREPLPGSRAADRASFYLSFKPTMKVDLDVADLGECQSAINDAEARLTIGEAVIARTRTEARKAWLFASLHTSEESLHSFIQSPQDILEDLRMNGFEVISHSFNLRKLDSLSVIVDRNSGNAISIASFLERGIEKFTTNIASISQSAGLFFSWVDAVFEGFAHIIIILLMAQWFNEIACIYAGFYRAYGAMANSSSAKIMRFGRGLLCQDDKIWKRPI